MNGMGGQKPSLPGWLAKHLLRTQSGGVAFTTSCFSPLQQIFVCPLLSTYITAKVELNAMPTAEISCPCLPQRRPRGVFMTFVHFALLQQQCETQGLSYDQIEQHAQQTLTAPVQAAAPAGETSLFTLA
jgi:hypothetical protein